LLSQARISLAFLTVAFLAAFGGGTPVTSGSATPSPTLPPIVTSQYPIPSASSKPLGIALGIDGSMWFTENAKSKIAQLNAFGKINEEVTPSKNAGPSGIASGSGPNLNLWFTETNLGKVGQITISGPPYAEYTLPDKAARPVGIALGSDGNMWVTDPGTDSVWRIRQIKKKPFVLFKQYRLATGAQPLNITNGPDGALWFTEPGTNSIGRLPVTGGPPFEYAVPTANSDPVGIATGTDNALWFTEQKARQIGRMSTTGTVTAEYLIKNAMTPDAILQGVDGDFYFTDTALNKVGQFLFRTHTAAFYHIPTANSEPTAMALGTDEQIYLTETAGNKIAQFKYFTP